MFIVFEGIDGSGKTTQSSLLADFFRDIHKREVLLTREPGGTVFAEKIRDLLLSTELDPKEQFLLILAGRYNHYHQKILPALQQDKIVICDRFILSTIAYQGYGMGLDLNFIKKLHNEIFDDKIIYPDYTIILNIDYAITRKSSDDTYEKKDREFYQRVINGYNELSQSSKNTFIVNANRSVTDIRNEILNIIKLKDRS